MTEPRGDGPVFTRYYRLMEQELKRAVDAIEMVDPLVSEQYRLMFNAEVSPIRWFYHTARTHANFYESCALRDQIYKLLNKSDLSILEQEHVGDLLDEWRTVLEDEKANAEAALPVMEADMRLDFRFGGDHTFSHGVDMLRVKLALIESELRDYLPTLRKALSE